MTQPVVFSVIESPLHPNLSDIFGQLGYREYRFPSVRKAISALKKQQPDVIIADFIYAYATNYDSNHISNLDSLLITLNKYKDRKPKILFFATKQEIMHVSELTEQYGQYLAAYESFAFPVAREQVKAALS